MPAVSSSRTTRLLKAALVVAAMVIAAGSAPVADIAEAAGAADPLRGDAHCCQKHAL